MTRLIILAGLLSTSLTVSAQDTQKFFKQSYGVASSTVYDNLHSLVKYKGTGVQLNLGNEKDKAKRFSQFENTFAWIPLRSTVENENYAGSATQINNRTSYTYLRKLLKKESIPFNIAVGAATFLDVNYRTYSNLITGKANNANSWDINLGLQAVAKASKNFEFKNRSFSASYQLGLPLIAFNHRPDYIGLPPIESIFEGKDDVGVDWKGLGRTTTIGSKYFYLNQQIMLEKIKSNGNRIRLAYNWNYSNNGFARHRYQNIISGISFGFVTNLSKNSSNI